MSVFIFHTNSRWRVSTYFCLIVYYPSLAMRREKDFSFAFSHRRAKRNYALCPQLTFMEPTYRDDRRWEPAPKEE